MVPVIPLAALLLLDPPELPPPPPFEPLPLTIPLVEVTCPVPAAPASLRSSEHVPEAALADLVVAAPPKSHAPAILFWEL